jgi:hypothetical protein
MLALGTLARSSTLGQIPHTNLVVVLLVLANMPLVLRATLANQIIMLAILASRVSPIATK